MNYTELAQDANAHWQQRLVSHHGRTHLDLFSGIGGFALAAASAGFKTIGFSEIEPYACKVLKKNWPDVPNHGDIRNMRGVRADLITGGFPCQPYSTSGKRRGASDDRALWPEMLRVIRESRPSWVLGENVSGIVSMELDKICADLEAEGYEVQPLLIPAIAADAPHQRMRCWILADLRAGNARTRLESAASASERDESGRETKMPSADCGHGDARRNAGNGADIRRGKIAEWQPKPGVGRMAHGVSNRPHRLRGLGNAIVPQVAAEILKNLVMANIVISDNPANP